MDKNIVSLELFDEVGKLNRLIRGNYSQIVAIDEALMYGSRTADAYADAITMLADNMHDLLTRMVGVYISLEVKKEGEEQWWENC